MGGTAYTKIDNALKSAAPYIAFRNGTLSAKKYQKIIESDSTFSSVGLNRDQLNLSARFPHDKHDFVRRAISQCRSHDLIASEIYEAEFVEEKLNHLVDDFSHGDNLTYIFPEECALLYSLALNFQPRNAVFMGSYYGYWSVFAKAAVPDLHVTLLDINPKVMDLARENYQRLGLASGAEFLVEDAEQVVTGLEDVDLLVLDAEGPKSLEVDEDHRDKAIYYPHLKAALGCLAPGALLVAHNVILSNRTDGGYFEEKQQSYRRQYSKFLALLRENFFYTIIDSTEGTLVARKR